jgi:hypothetical protein
VGSRGKGAAIHQRKRDIELDAQFIFLPLSGQSAVTIRMRSTSPRSINSFISKPVMMVLPAPVSSASRKPNVWQRQQEFIDRLPT